MPLSLRDEIPSYDAFRKVDFAGFRVGWMGDYESYLSTEPGLLDLCERSLEGISTHGVMVENCMPAYDMARLWRTWLTLRHWSQGGLKAFYDDPETRKLLKPEIIWEIEGGFDMPASRVAEAAIARADWYRALHELFEHYDILALPTAQVFPFSADTQWPDR